MLRVDYLRNHFSCGISFLGHAIYRQLRQLLLILSQNARFTHKIYMLWSPISLHAPACACVCCNKISRMTVGQYKQLAIYDCKQKQTRTTSDNYEWALEVHCCDVQRAFNCYRANESSVMKKLFNEQILLRKWLNFLLFLILAADK